MTFSSDVPHAERPLESVLRGSDSEIPDGEQPSHDASTTSTRRRNRKEEDQSSNNCILLTLKLIIGIVFFFIVLTCSVMSKLTLVSLTDALRHYTWDFQKSGTTRPVKETEEWRKNKGEKTIALYWYLLLILLLPNAITFLRCLFFGVLGKTKKSYPWPRWSSAFLVSR